MKRILMIAAVGMAFASPAWAQSQNCSPQLAARGDCTTTYNTDTDGDLTDTETTSLVSGETAPGIAVTEAGPSPILDINGQQVFDSQGRPLYQPTGSTDTNAQAYGYNSTAVGTGARVGQYVPGKCSAGKPDYEKGVWRCEDGQGNPIQGATYTPASTVPAHNGTALGAGAVVEHHGSTAVGAGAKTVKENEVVLGTEKTTVRAPGIPQTTVNATGLVTHDAAGNLGTDGGQTFSTINAHSALLSEHTARLDEHAKGLAIAMAMPSTWLSDKKSFGVFGSVGGFGDETALGFAAIGRLNETWSVNAKLGADTSFDELGWQVGFGAQW